MSRRFELQYKSLYSGQWVPSDARFWFLSSALRTVGRRVASLRWAREWRVSDLRTGRVIAEVRRVR